LAIKTTSVNAVYYILRDRLGEVIPEVELRYKAELIFEINKLKKQRGAVILGHNYMEPALYLAVADYVGDSLELAKIAKTTTCDPIVFCGVRFMAETAKILNPKKTVLLPAIRAGCSLAESINLKDLHKLKKEYPGVPVVSYINTYAEIKAESDIICTSGNAAKVVLSLKSNKIIFLPDEYLAKNVAHETGKTIIFPTETLSGKKEEDNNRSDDELIGWHGRCEVHELFSVEDIENVRNQFPEVVILAHPECSPEVISASDFSASTSKMIEYVKQINASEFLLLTECSMADNIIAENPDKEILRLCSHRCPHMAEITLEETLKSLQYDQHKIDIPEKIRIKAQKAIDRMLKI
jgi:quinolinate synthase